MFTHLAHCIVRRRRAVLGATGLTLLLAIVIGSGVFGRLSTGGFENPASESARAADRLDAEFGTGSPDLVFVVTASDGDVDSPEMVSAGLALTDEVALIPGTSDVVSYWSAGSVPVCVR